MSPRCAASNQPRAFPFRRRAGKLSDTKVDPDTPDILSCDELRTFWVSWESGRIAVGTGALVGLLEFMAWQDPEPDAVAYLSLSGWSDPALWDIVQFQGL